MFCSQCGSSLQTTDRFCANCGAPVQQSNGSSNTNSSTDATINTVTSGNNPPPDSATPDTAALSDTTVHNDVTSDATILNNSAADDSVANNATSGNAIPDNSAPNNSAPNNSISTDSVPGDSAPSPDPVSTPQESVSTPQESTAVRRHTIRPWMIVLIAAITVIALITVFLTYRAELWGGTSLPDTAQIIEETGSSNANDSDDDDTDTKDVTAEQVTQALNTRGLDAEPVYEFNAKTSDTFLGYVDAEAGQRVASNSTVQIRVSAGPGVPEGTVGSQAVDTVDELESMGVPVYYKQVTVSSTSDYHDGQIVATSPADGTALSSDQLSDGIYVAVAATTDADNTEGIPFDIVGMNTSDATDLLENMGYTVTAEARYSSSDYLGKVITSNPSPGTTTTSDEITLYYGVDSSANWDLLTTTDDTYGFQLADGDLSILAGQYCKAEVTDESEDCITLEAAASPTTGDDDTAIRIAGHDDAMTLYNFSQDYYSGSLVEPDATAGISDSSDLAMYNHLLLSDWGMFEVYAGDGLPYCGTVSMDDNMSGYCDNGTFVDNDQYTDWHDSTGVTYSMEDFLVYFPVGSDIDSLEDSGYFDADALAEASASDEVDTSRPFILVRDSSQYDITSVDANAYDADPFVPSNQNGDNPLVAMKPAVSNDTVYYLVEDTDLDWDSLPDADIGNSDNTNTENSDDDNDNNESDSGSDTGTTSQSLFAEIAGTYGFSSGAGAWSTQLTVNDDGTFSGTYSDWEAEPSTDEYPNGTTYESVFTGRFSDATANDDGTYTLQCATDELSIDGNVGDERIEDGTLISTVEPYGVSPCDTFTVYPQGYDSSLLSDDIVTWSLAWYSALPDTLETPILVNDSSNESFYIIPDE